MRKLNHLILILVWACSAPNQQANTSGLQGLENDLDSLFGSKIDPEGPGAALLVSFDGEMLIGKGYGLRDIENKLPITRTTNLRMASVSKQFTVLAVLSLVDQGLLQLDDSVGSIFPFESLQKTTIEQLINHTSGILDAELAFFDEKNWDPSKVANNDDLVEWYAEADGREFEPGTQWQYNNGAYELLAAIVEKVSGKDFASYARENVFEKAGMASTNFFDLSTPIEIDERAVCYLKENGSWNSADGHFLNGMLGAGGVYTNLNDFFQYDLTLRKQEILSKDLHALDKPTSMSLPSEATQGFVFLKDKEWKYSMGWIVSEGIQYHTGGWFGASTIVIRETERPLTVAIFMNSSSSESRMELINATYELVDKYLKK